MSDTDQLRRAAALTHGLADTAAETRPGTWHTKTSPRSNGPATTVHNGTKHVTGYVRTGVAHHIALWQPSTGKEVAAMLACASEMDPTERETVAGEQCGWCGYDHLANISQALAGQASKET